MSAINAYQNVDLSQAIVQPLEDDAWKSKDISVAVLRLDRIHPVLSGNKWFKLTYHLQQARDQGKKGLLTFGGAWSNHLVATAIACKLNGLDAVGIVRGEAPAVLSPSLQDVLQYGMRLEFVTRQDYGEEATLITRMTRQYPDLLVVPQGGQSEAGVQGAAEILSLVPDAAHYTCIACAAGTGTMLAGIVRSLAPHQQAVGFSSLKLPDPHNNTLLDTLTQYAQEAQASYPPPNLIYDYHFGGYARRNTVLTNFMNDLYAQHDLPTDIVYTGKMMYGIKELIHNNYFKPNTRILAIHSGGLQGNRSLPTGLLRFA